MLLSQDVERVPCLLRSPEGKNLKKATSWWVAERPAAMVAFAKEARDGSHIPHLAWRPVAMVFLGRWGLLEGAHQTVIERLTSMHGDRLAWSWSVICREIFIQNNEVHAIKFGCKFLNFSLSGRQLQIWRLVGLGLWGDDWADLNPIGDDAASIISRFIRK
jgi:hypothetical protein